MVEKILVSAAGIFLIIVIHIYFLWPGRRGTPRR